MGDGIHYVKEIGADKIPATKAIYGFSSMSVYKTVVRKLEEYAVFTHYDGSEQPIDLHLELSEDLDYRDNHPNPQIALSMEVIIQIENNGEDMECEVFDFMGRDCDILPRLPKECEEFFRREHCNVIHSFVLTNYYYYGEESDIPSTYHGFVFTKPMMDADG